MFVLFVVEVGEGLIEAWRSHCAKEIVVECRNTIDGRLFSEETIVRIIEDGSRICFRAKTAASQISWETDDGRWTTCVVRVSCQIRELRRAGLLGQPGLSCLENIRFLCGLFWICELDGLLERLWPCLSGEPRWHCA